MFSTPVFNGKTLDPAEILGVVGDDGPLVADSRGGDENVGDADGASLVGQSCCSQYDGIDVTGALTYAGALALNFGSTFDIGSYTFNIFNVGPTSGSLNSVALAGLYSGTLSNTGGIWCLNSGNNTWTFTQTTGQLSLTVIPGPRPPSPACCSPPGCFAEEGMTNDECWCAIFLIQNSPAMRASIFRSYWFLPEKPRGHLWSAVPPDFSSFVLERQMEQQMKSAF